MPRNFVINGESMVSVTGPDGVAFLSGGSQLGLTTDAITVDLEINSEPLIVDAYGKNNPVDEQVFGGTATIVMNLIHFNAGVLAAIVQMQFPAYGVTVAEGALGRAGSRRGGGINLGAPGNNYITLSIYNAVPNSASTVQSCFQFPTAYLKEQPYHFPLGTEKSVVRLVWRALAYSVDPWNNGTGSQGVPLYTRTNFVAAANP